MADMHRVNKMRHRILEKDISLLLFRKFHLLQVFLFYKYIYCTMIYIFIYVCLSLAVVKIEG